MQAEINNLSKKICMKRGIDFDKKIHPILEPDGWWVSELEDMCDKFTTVPNIEHLNKSPEFA